MVSLFNPHHPAIGPVRGNPSQSAAFDILLKLENTLLQVEGNLLDGKSWNSDLPHPEGRHLLRSAEIYNYLYDIDYSGMQWIGEHTAWKINMMQIRTDYAPLYDNLPEETRSALPEVGLFLALIEAHTYYCSNEYSQVVNILQYFIDNDDHTVQPNRCLYALYDAAEERARLVERSSAPIVPF